MNFFLRFSSTFLIIIMNTIMLRIDCARVLQVILTMNKQQLSKMPSTLGYLQKGDVICTIIARDVPYQSFKVTKWGWLWPYYFSVGQCMKNTKKIKKKTMAKSIINISASLTMIINIAFFKKLSHHNKMVCNTKWSIYCNWYYDVSYYHLNIWLHYRTSD